MNYRKEKQKMNKNNIEKFITLFLILSSISLITFIAVMLKNNDPPDNTSSISSSSTSINCSSSSETKFVIKDTPDNEDEFSWGPLRRKYINLSLTQNRQEIDKCQYINNINILKKLIVLIVNISNMINVLVEFLTNLIVILKQLKHLQKNIFLKQVLIKRSK